MIGYEHGPQYPESWDEPENEEQAPEFQLAEEYEFTYWSGPVSYTGYLWTKSATKSEKSLRCQIRLVHGTPYERTVKVRHDDRGEYIMLPKDILQNVKVRP